MIVVRNSKVTYKSHVTESFTWPNSADSGWQCGEEILKSSQFSHIGRMKAVIAFNQMNDVLFMHFDEPFRDHVNKQALEMGIISVSKQRH